MPSIAETTLSSPLTSHLYSDFLLAFSTQPASNTRVRGQKRQSIPLGVRLGEKFRSIAGLSISPDDLIPHTAHETKMLVNHRPAGIDTQAACDVLEQSYSDTKEIMKSLSAGLDKPRRDQGLAEVDLPMPLSLTLEPQVVEKYITASFWDHIVSVTSRRCHYSNWVSGPGYHTSRQVTVVQTAGRWIVMSHDALVMIKDISMSHWLLHMYFSVCPKKSHLGPLLTKFTSWGLDLLVRTGEEGYETIKGLEGMVKLRLIELSEEILDTASQVRSMLRKYRKKLDWAYRSHTITRPDGIDGLWKLCKEVRVPDDLSELFSFLKLLGHPYIDPIRGCESSKAIAQGHRRISPSATKQLEWSFCHLYTRGYLLKKGRWPPLVFSLPEGKTCKLKELHDNNHPSLPLGLGLYDASDWDYALFEAHIDFDYGQDILSLMSDTAISHKRSEIDHSWKGRLPYHIPKATSSTRVLEELLRRQDLDMRGICDRVSKRDIPFDWKIVTVCPKEREMKLEPRTFAMMVLEMRSFFVLTEQNLAQGIFSYIPEQTMTDSKNQLLNRFLGYTRQDPSGDKVNLMIELDFSRWNLKFERRTIDPLGRRFDQIFGTDRLYDVIHEFYEQCMIVLRHSSFTPTLTKPSRGHIPDQPGIWNGHPTGMEGIFQKGWTAATICIIQAAIWPFGLRYNLAGQGDNQVLFIECTRGKEESKTDFHARVRRLSLDVTRSCSEFAASVGHELKAEECTYSTSFTSYGKELWYKGRVLETTCKSIARMFPSTSTDSPSMFQIYSKVSATGAATTDRSGYTLPIFLFTKLVENWLIRREFRWSYLHGTFIRDSLGGILYKEGAPNWCILLTLVPSNLGGLPVCTLAEFLYRGHQDPLASSLTSLDVFVSIPEVCLYIGLLQRKLLLCPPDKINTDGLILDPFSIPLNRSPPSTARLASRLKGTLVKITKNIGIRDLLTYNDSRRATFFSDLLRTKPLYPKIIHDIYKSSLYGVCDTFSKRFTNTSTLYKISRASEEVDLTAQGLLYDKEYLRQTYFLLSMVYRVRQPVWHGRRSLSIYALTIMLRSAWNCGDMMGVTNIHPLDLGVISIVPMDSAWILARDRDNCPLVTSLGLSVDSLTALESRGTVTPYIGSETSEKSVAKWVKPVDSSPPQRDAIRLLQIRKMLTVPGSQLYLYLTALAQTRCEYDVEQLSMFTRERVGGTDSHRYNTTDAPMGSYVNSLVTWHTNMTISTNKSRSLGSIDRPVSFQEVNLTLNALSCWYLSQTALQPPYGCVLVILHDSSLPMIADSVVDGPIEFPKGPTVPPKLFYSLSSDIKVSSRFPKAAIMNQGLFQENSLEPRQVDALSAIFLDTLTGRIRRIRTGGYVRSEVRSSRVIDLPEAQRIPYDHYLDGMTRACAAYISGRFVRSLHKDIDPLRHYLSLVAESALLLVPAALATLKECTSVAGEYGKPVIGGSSKETNIKWWVLQIVSREAEFTRQPGHYFQDVYLSGLSSLSSSLSTFVSTWLAQSILRRPTKDNIVASKKLLRVVTKLGEGDDEYLRATRLATLIDVMGFDPYLRKLATSPQAVIRKYRLSPAPSVPVYDRPPPVCLTVNPGVDAHRCVGSGGPLLLESLRPSLSLVDMVYSYELRPWFSVSDAHLRWGPIWSRVQRESSILVIGIGAGGILRVIPPQCKVTGVDLCSALERLGQDCLTYVPPVNHPGFSLHPVSWVLGGDITNDAVLDCLLSECREGKYDTVLVDIEGVSATTRLKVRHQFAKSGPKAYVRVSGSSDDIEEVRRSFCAFREKGDIIWEPEIGLSREVILGAGSAPLGLYTAWPSHPGLHPRNEYLHNPETSYDEKRVSEQLAFWSLSGEISTDVIAIESWVRDYRQWPDYIRDELLELEKVLETGEDTTVNLPKHLIRGFCLLWKLHKQDY